jgi:alkanesulfonate monooxygenase
MAETLCVPQPLQRPHPPILIGGMGEKRTLRLVARYADACNLFAFAGAAEVGRKLDVLRRHCDSEKRDFEAIERTTLGTAHLAPGKQSPADVIRELRELAKAGVQHAIVNLPNVHEITPLETLAKEVIPAISEL